MNELRIAIVVYDKTSDKASETFISAHKKYLASQVLSSSEFPSKEQLDKGGFKTAVKTFLLKRKLRYADLVLAEYGTIGAEIFSFLEKHNILMAVEFRGYDLSIQRILEENKEKYRGMIRYAKKLIVKSSVMKTRLLKMGADEEKIRIIPSGYNNRIFNSMLFDRNAVNFLYVGRLVEKKGPEIIIRAFSNVRSEIGGKLIMVGDGPLKQRCEGLISDLALSDRVILTGVRSPEEIRELMKTTRCFLNHSVTADNGDAEGLPNVVLEAMASGIPVIASRHGGNPDVITHGENGILVDERDESGLSEWIKTLGNDPEMSESLGKNGYTKVSSNFTSEMSIRRLKQELDEIRV